MNLFQGMVKSSGPTHNVRRKRRLVNPLRHAFEPLEPRTLMTALYWQGSVSGVWNTSDANWNTAVDGTGTQVAWNNAANDDAVFTNSAPVNVTVSSAVKAHSIIAGAGNVTIVGAESVTTAVANSSTGAGTITFQPSVTIPAGSSFVAQDGASATTSTQATSGTSGMSPAITGEIDATEPAIPSSADQSPNAAVQGSLVVAGTAAATAVDTAETIGYLPSVSQSGTLPTASENLDSMSLSGLSTESETSYLTVASLAATGSLYAGGQSFTPNVAGPDGAGTSGTASSLILENITFGYGTTVTTTRARTCFIYSIELDDPSEVGQFDGFVGKSSAISDGSAFGSGSSTRAFIFDGQSLDPTQQYYVYFATDQYLRYASTGPYSGGNAVDGSFFDLTPFDLQFQVGMEIPI